MSKYRIKEYDGRFNIQIMDERGNYTATDYMGEKWEWKNINRPAPLTSKTYKTLKKARKQIERWNKGEVYHD